MEVSSTTKVKGNNKNTNFEESIKEYENLMKQIEKDKEKIRVQRERLEKFIREGSKYLY